VVFLPESAGLLSLCGELPDAVATGDADSRAKVTVNVGGP